MPHPQHRAAIALRRAAAAGVAAAFALALAAAWLSLEHGFRAADDEGYAMVTIALYRQGHLPYAEIFSQYGPAWFQIQAGAFSALGLSVDHDTGRAFTFVVAALACLVLALAARRATGSSWAAAVVLLASAGVFRAVAHEPFHPQAVALLLTATFMACTSRAVPGPRALAFAAGALAGLLALVKVNLGAFAVAALVAIAASAAPSLLLAVTLALGAAPWLLMRPLLHLPEILALAMTASLSILTLGLVQLRRLAPRGGAARESTAFVALASAGFATAAGLSLGLELLRGTPPAALWHGVVGQHADGSTFHLLPRLSPALLACAALAHAAGLAAAWRPRLGDRLARPAGIAAALAILASLRDMDAAFVLPSLLWTTQLALPGSARRGPSRVPAGAVAAPALIAVLQSLQVYPVHGSQAIVASAISAAALGGIVASASPHVLRFRAAIPALAVTLMAVLSLSDLRALLAERGGLVNSRVLRGCRRLRLPEADMATLEWLTLNLRSGSHVFTVPGMWSFCSWADRPPLTTRTTTNWTVALSAAEQEEIARLLEATPDCRIVRHAFMQAAWEQGRRVDSPALRAIDRSHAVAGSSGGYELLVPRGEGPSCAAWIDGGLVRVVLPDGAPAWSGAALVTGDRLLPLTAPILPAMTPGHAAWAAPATAFSPGTVLRLSDAGGRRVLSLPLAGVGSAQ